MQNKHKFQPLEHFHSYIYGGYYHSLKQDFILQITNGVCSSQWQNLYTTCNMNMNFKHQFSRYFLI